MWIPISGVDGAIRSPEPIVWEVMIKIFGSFSDASDHFFAELAAGDEPRSLHLAVEIIGHRPRLDGFSQGLFNQISDLIPSQVFQHHDC